MQPNFPSFQRIVENQNVKRLYEIFERCDKSRRKKADDENVVRNVRNVKNEMTVVIAREYE